MPEQSAQLAVLLDRARMTWTLVEAIEAELRAILTITRTLCMELQWTGPGRRALLMQRIDSVNESARLTRIALIDARYEALEASNRAAVVGWGIRVGHRYRLSGERFPSEPDVVVESLRPAEKSPLGVGMLCIVSEGKTRFLVILGRDEAKLTEVSTNVISLQARLEARKGLSPR